MFLTFDVNILQNSWHFWGDTGKEQGARPAVIPEILVLYHAGRSFTASPDRGGGHDVFSKPKTRGKNAAVPERASGTILLTEL